MFQNNTLSPTLHKTVYWLGDDPFLLGQFRPTFRGELAISLGILGVLIIIIGSLGGGFIYFLFSPIFGEDSNFD